MRKLLIVALAAVLIPFEISHAQSGDQTVTFESARGRQTATLKMPSARRPPLVILMSVTGAQDVAPAPASAGVASIQFDPADEDLAAQWIAFLRNDERFSTTTVVGEGGGLAMAVAAARAARADGVAVRGEPGSAASEIARLIAAKTTIAKESPESDAHRIAEFARTVPALGRRGTSATRPTGARRSLRHVTLATMGTLRIAVEWGAPEKRGRDIWGALVPWNQEWMPGADETTTLTTNSPVRLGTLDVPAGDHTLFAHPSADRFELIVSKDVGQFHTQHN